MSQDNILVVGGCGFLGSHIVRTLLDTQEWSSIHIVSRNPTNNRHQGAHYHSSRPSSRQDMQRVLDEVQPSAVIHCASATVLETDATEKGVLDTDIACTHNLLTCAASTKSVRAFVFTSSTSVMADSPYSHINEDAPVRSVSSGAGSDVKSKAVADLLVLSANGTGDMHTLCLRLPTFYSDRGNTAIPSVFRTVRSGGHRIQIGDNSLICETISGRNAATAHVLAVKALLGLSLGRENGAKVDGEAFFITDGLPVFLWDFHRQICAAAGGQVKPEEIVVVPRWLILGLACCIEWFYWIFTLGFKKPKAFRRDTLEPTGLKQILSIDKARKRLGYSPVDDRDEQIKKAVEWYLSGEADYNARGAAGTKQD